MNNKCENTRELLEMRQNYSLKGKVHLSKQLIEEWHNHWEGKVYVAFSGGKDSTVLLHLVRSLYPDTPAVFVDTGLEYPEIKDFVNKTENVTVIKPKMTYRQVIDKYGYPVVSKTVARFVNDLQNQTPNNEATRNLRLTGYNRKGVYCSTMKLPEKWKFLIDAPFSVSEKCCNVIKKEPAHRFDKESGRKPYIGTMAADSNYRGRHAIKYGCNVFGAKNPQSRPLTFWKTEDVWQYIKENDLPYCSVYDTGIDNTGCVWCMFGAHLEKEPNRFQTLKETHPRIWNGCINKMGLGEVLDFIGVLYE